MELQVVISIPEVVHRTLPDNTQACKSRLLRSEQYRLWVNLNITVVSFQAIDRRILPQVEV
jgi:hypothetical protein